MVYDGTPTKTMLPAGVTKAHCVLYTVPGLDSANEYSVLDTMQDGFPIAVASAILIVERTGGAENTIEVKVQVSMDGTNYVDSGLSVVLKDVMDYWPNQDRSGAEDILKAWRYWKVVAIDEGTNNTLTAKLWLSGRG